MNYTLLTISRNEASILNSSGKRVGTASYVYRVGWNIFKKNNAFVDRVPKKANVLSAYIDFVACKKADKSKTHPSLCPPLKLQIAPETEEQKKREKLLTAF
ncbi:hypothetical protein PV783_13565 [Chitinophaga sp. CC14]|uniref:hypothetical protein n=1 Tax=Chitinophaga sp. CC14 TaxID=3029199 RepID=UPI003B79364E